MVRHESEIEPVGMAMAGAVGVTKQIVIGPDDGYDGFCRVFTVQSGGNTPSHRHDWFHANYILEGEGKVVIEGVEQPVKAGSVAYIEGGKSHNFINTGKTPLKFICLVPRSGDKY
ncbi:MAG: cupin [Treponema sp. GWB1_62_6]|nr:MAG: cupin [Treponema sp. GWA1_62_8]OHE68728.1 MAG: cupin [Treponema sp. GWB1_62_6]OHE68827.1 MAG: cupin [Treponema sp. GWC1_61_84]OHE76233.1 MAG: cupin [Treponema sp. RIFOXYC1_FULL_61_9]HCM28657.1 cupin [Treponema sp.]